MAFRRRRSFRRKFKPRRNFRRKVRRSGARRLRVGNRM